MASEEEAPRWAAQSKRDLRDFNERKRQEEVLKSDRDLLLYLADKYRGVRGKEGLVRGLEVMEERAEKIQFYTAGILGGAGFFLGPIALAAATNWNHLGVIPFVLTEIGSVGGSIIVGKKIGGVFADKIRRKAAKRFDIASRHSKIESK